MGTVGSVAAALGAAALFAAAVVLQHRSAHHTVTRQHLGLLAHLASRPGWVTGMLVGTGAVSLYTVALYHGRLVIVQPLLVCGLVFALPLALLVEHRRPAGREWGWAGVVVAGLVAFLLAVRPDRGAGAPGSLQLAVPTLAMLGVIVLVVLLAYKPVRRHRATLLGFAAGAGFGLNGALLKDAVTLGVADPVGLLQSWTPYALVPLGLGAIVLSQRAYQSGPLASTLPGMYIAEVLTAILFGAVAFGEMPSTAPILVTAQVLGLVALSVGLVYLSRATPDARLVEKIAAGTAPRNSESGPDETGARGADARGRAPSRSPRSGYMFRAPGKVASRMRW